MKRGIPPPPPTGSARREPPPAAGASRRRPRSTSAADAAAGRVLVILVGGARVERDVVVHELDVAFLEVHRQHQLRPVGDFLHGIERFTLGGGGAVVLAKARGGLVVGPAA